MNEAGRCDRISLMHAGKVLVTDVPAELVRKRGVATLEEAFIGYLQDAEARKRRSDAGGRGEGIATLKPPGLRSAAPPGRRLSAWPRLELQPARDAGTRRDPVRATMALARNGHPDVRHRLRHQPGCGEPDLRRARSRPDRAEPELRAQPVRLALLRRTPADHRLRRPRSAHARGRTRAGHRDSARFRAQRGARRSVQIGAWVDGAMPQRAETVQGYVQGMHQGWLLDMAQRRLGQGPAGPATIETRFRYNPDVKSLPAMVPAVIPMLLLMIPAMLTALSVVREKGAGLDHQSLRHPGHPQRISARQATALRRARDAQLRADDAAGRHGLRRADQGQLPDAGAAALLFVMFSTGFGLFASTFTRSQIAAMFVTMIGTMIPAIQFAGMLNPVSSLEGVGAFIGRIYPASHFPDHQPRRVQQGAGLLQPARLVLAAAAGGAGDLGLSIVLLKKQET
jgi:ribosome-dependent ATPase